MLKKKSNSYQISLLQGKRITKKIICFRGHLKIDMLKKQTFIDNNFTLQRFCFPLILFFIYSKKDDYCMLFISTVTSLVQ